MRKERLARELGCMDEELLAKAWETDDGKKLSRYAARKFPLTRVAALAACAALALVAFSAILPGLQTKQHLPIEPSEELIPPVISHQGALRINSIDKLNYYGAMQILAGAPKASASGSGSGTEGVGQDEKPDQPQVTEPTGDVDPTPNTTPSWDDGYYVFYELDPSEVFTITEVVFFQIELTDENGFLASKLGLGIVDVVITDNSLDAIITFRNGDRFFSCLQNGRSKSVWDFSTHKYIQDFGVVKNGKQENYSFHVYFEDGQVTDFVCGLSENGGPWPDQNVKIASLTQVSFDGGTFTIAELEASFNQYEEA